MKRLIAVDGKARVATLSREKPTQQWKATDRETTAAAYGDSIEDACDVLTVYLRGHGV